MSLLGKLTVGALAAAGVVALGSRAKKSPRVVKPALAKTAAPVLEKPAAPKRRKRHGSQKRTKTA